MSELSRAPLWVLVALQAGISAAGLIVEIVAARMIAPYVGMSVYTWTAIIAVVLAGFSVGHWWGGRIAARVSGQALGRCGWVLLAAALATAGAGLVLRMTAGPVLQSLDHPLSAITAITGLAFFLPSLFAGVPAPILAVVAMRSGERPEHALGAMFAAGAAGAIAGTLLAGFVFIAWLGSAATLAVVAAFYAAAAAIVFALGRVGRRTALTAALAAALALAVGVRALALPPICDAESSYFCIRTVTLSGKDEAPVRLMVLDHLAHGIGARDAPERMFTEHTAMLDALPRMRMGQRRFSSFHIGGGTYSVPRAWAHRDTGPVTVAEIDPAVTRSAIDDFWLDSASLTVLHADGRVALTRTDATYDVIVGDAFTDIAVPHHLVTREFFGLVRDRLADDGVFAMNAIDNVDRMQALTALYVTLRDVFPSVEVWTEARPPQPGERRVFVLLAGDGESPVSSVETFSPDPARYAPLDKAYLDDLAARMSAPILTDDHAPVDRLMGLAPVLD